ncbi:hypothetical protein MKY41_15895 [Sporosarcina sp. FSL W7-1349]|uniref:hypothetical protein n=1 Tax=Sporosarcina sp. FSL W7-1349 TaxID=2921561 RepID=UPI0030F77DDB
MKKFGLLCFFLLLSACSKPEVFEHIEVSSFETMTESTGSVIKFIPSGYVNSNSITYTKDWRDKTKMEVSAIEDHYDVDGNYIKTVVFSSSDEYKKFHNQVG